MDISTIPKRKDDLNHTPEPQAEEEHDTEITVIVTPPTTSLKSILKHNNQSPPVDYESPKKLPATSNELRAAMTSSPSSPQSTEHKYSAHESLVNNKETGDPTEAVMPTTKPRTRIKRTLTCEFNQKTKTNPAIDSSPTSTQTPTRELYNPEEDEDWIHTNKQLNEIVITDPDTSEKCLPIFSAINLKKKRKMLFAPMDFNNLSVDALVDSGALVSCLPESEYQKIKSVSPDNILKEMDPPTFKLQVAKGDIQTPTKTVQLQFELGDWTFKETFIVATKMTGPILGLTFLKNNSAILDVSQALLHFPHLTYAIAAYDNETVSRHHKVTIKNQLTIMPDQCITIEAGINLRTITNTTGIIHHTEQYSGDHQLVVASSRSTVTNSKIEIRVTNTSPSPFTLKKNANVAEFTILSPQEAKQLHPLNSAALKVLAEDNTEQALEYVNELLKSYEKPQTAQNFWFPTPDKPGDPSTHTPIQSRILREIEELENIQKLNPHNNPEDRATFLANFKWTDSQLSYKDKKDIEKIFVEYNDIFAMHRLDIGINNDFKIQITPKSEQPAYTQSLPCPVNLKDDLTVELALMHYYGIITTLPFSKYASPIFAQRKPNGRLRLLVDLRKINNLISDDYINNNHSVSTLSDAAQHCT